jgi:16S rRNA U1498 N3-methylase RsmE
MAVSKGFIPVSLGRNRLRTETAGIVSCAVFQCMTTRYGLKTNN